MSDRRQQAWDEAQRRYATRDRQAGFVSGAAWADSNPQPRAITRGDLGTIYAEFMQEEGHPVRRLERAINAVGVTVVDDA